jgi:hypothetical protein
LSPVNISWKKFLFYPPRADPVPLQTPPEQQVGTAI